MLTKQNSMLIEAKTNVLRLEALNKFIVAKEKHTGGREVVEIDAKGGAKQEQAALSHLECFLQVAMTY